MNKKTNFTHPSVLIRKHSIIQVLYINIDHLCYNFISIGFVVLVVCIIIIALLRTQFNGTATI